MPSSRKRTRWILLALIALFLLALPKLLPMLSGKSASPTTSASGPGSTGAKGGGPPDEAKVQVTAHIIRPAALAEKILATGTLRAGDAIQLKSETSGRITRLPFREGTHVPKGKLLVKLNDADLRARLTKARAAFALARTFEQRQGKLSARDFISRQEYDQAREAVQSAQGDIEIIEAQIAKTEIRAPFPGVVGLTRVSVGDILSQGTPIANFVSDSPLEVDFAVPEQYFDSVSPGKRVTFTVQGGDRVHAAKVSAVDPLVDPNTRTVKVRAVCEGIDSSLAPGAFARLSMVFREKPDALSVPSQAILPTRTGQQVYLLRRGAALAQPVRTGLRTEAEVEITEGVKPGDTVITTGLILIRPGSPVEVKGLGDAENTMR